MSFPLKRKILNDPVYGFINLPVNTAFEITEHLYFQRLRNIKQLGLTYYVYPGATHNRLQHTLGAAHLMGLAIETIRSKGHRITAEEAEAVTMAILLHDIGHGPFSHALENTLVENIHHEYISECFMERLNKEYGGLLDMAIQIFRNQYHKTFLHQLVAGQLDVDRLDYLKRDSHFTGVSEGVIGTERIIKMLNVVDDKLVVESKGIYSIEKFLIARRLMYWQVYLHKTVISAEMLLVKILQRARDLALRGTELFATPALKFFLYNTIRKEDFGTEKNQTDILDLFSQLDDSDVISAVKTWTSRSDKILSILSSRLIHRKLLKVELQKTAISEDRTNTLRKNAARYFNITEEDAAYLVFTDSITNYAYLPKDDKINILYNSGELTDIAEASDMLNIQVLSKTVTKHYLCYPKECIQL